MDFVNIVDLEAAAGRGIIDSFSELSDLIHPVVGCSIYLENIKRAPLRDFDAGFLIGVEIQPGAVAAVQGFGKNASG
jgi:hypothetical protein